MPDGGVVKISARNVLTSDEHFVEIIIEDTGRGIEPDILPKIFDPFFTTKESGTGLGLSTTYSIIKKHHGDIKIKSQLRKGTKITIQLPATTEIISLTEKSDTVSNEKSYKILILDDNDMILNVTEEMLSQLGHIVHTAQKGEDAIMMYKRELSDNSPFDLLILDLTIPNGLGGKEVVTELSAINPQLKAIVSSGYSAAPIISNYKKFGFSGAISKPYQIEDILKVIHEVMEEK